MRKYGRPCAVTALVVGLGALLVLALAPTSPEQAASAAFVVATNVCQTVVLGAIGYLFVDAGRRGK